MCLKKNAALLPNMGRWQPYTFFRENFNFVCKFHKRKDLVFMKAMSTSNLWNTWNVKKLLATHKLPT